MGGRIWFTSETKNELYFLLPTSYGNFDAAQATQHSLRFSDFAGSLEALDADCHHD